MGRKLNKLTISLLITCFRERCHHPSRWCVSKPTTTTTTVQQLGSKRLFRLALSGNLLPPDWLTADHPPPVGWWVNCSDKCPYQPVVNKHITCVKQQWGPPQSLPGVLAIKYFRSSWSIFFSLYLELKKERSQIELTQQFNRNGSPGTDKSFSRGMPQQLESKLHGSDTVRTAGIIQFEMSNRRWENENCHRQPTRRYGAKVLMRRVNEFLRHSVSSF